MNKYAEHIAEVAKELWGEPNKKLSHGNQLRFGTFGSKSVDTNKGTFFDHETQESGGFTDLCKMAYGVTNGELAEFMDKRFGIEKDPTFAKKNGNKVTHYDYIGDHGALVYQVIRIDYDDGTKTFRQRHLRDNGTWENSLSGVKRIPYRLPEILHSKEKDRWIWVVEGEKCADALTEIGMIATTNNGGSKNWKDDEMSPWFQDRRVIVVPDNDEAGKNHAAKVVNSLLPVAKEIRYLDLSEDLPPKGDIYDWLKQGRTRKQLEAVVRKAPKVEAQLEHDPAMDDAEKPEIFPVMAIKDLRNMPPIQWAVHGLITATGFNVFYGPPGCGKTFCLLDMALSIATGTEFHGMQTTQCAVLYIAGEGLGGLPKRITAWTDNRGVGVPDSEIPFFVLPVAVNMTDRMDEQKLLATIDALEEKHQVKFGQVFVDTVARALLGADENSATDMGKFVKSCDAIREHTGGGVTAAHHSGKDASKGMRGSTALMGAVDTSVVVKRAGSQMTLTMDKQKDAEPIEDMFFEMESVDVGLIGGETSVYLRRITADEVAAGKTTLNETQLKAMNCLRDATDRNDAISIEVARDSFTYWMAEKEELDAGDPKLKDRARKAWKRAIDALESADILVVRAGSKKVEWVKETDKAGHGSDTGLSE